jgi:hypothetical protein
VKADGIILSIRKRRLSRQVGLSPEALNQSLAVLPRQHHGDAVKFLLRRSDGVSKAVVDELSGLTESFIRSFGETYVHVPDFDVSTPSPGAYSYTLPGDQREKVLAEAGGWIPEENISYVTRREFDWSGMKSFIESLTDENPAESIAAMIKSRRPVV